MTRKFIIVRSALSGTVRRYFSNTLEVKSRRALKGDQQPSRDETRLKNDSTKEKTGGKMKSVRKKRRVMGKEGGLLGKVTVIQRAHRAISHKAAAGGLYVAFVGTFRKYLSPPRVCVDPPPLAHRITSFAPSRGRPRHNARVTVNLIFLPGVFLLIRCFFFSRIIPVFFPR